MGNGSIITMAYFVVVHRCRGSLRYFVPRAPDVPSFRSYASNPFCVVTKSGRFLPTLPSNLNIPQPRLKDSLYPATPKTFKNLSFLPKINKKSSISIYIQRISFSSIFAQQTRCTKFRGLAGYGNLASPDQPQTPCIQNM